MLGGENNFPADQRASEQILSVVPEVRDAAWANRGFHQRAARWIAGRGVKQFIDIGSGLPTAGNTHDVVRSGDTSCRVAYGDNDPLVRTQSRQLLAGVTGARASHGDLPDPDHLL